MLLIHRLLFGLLLGLSLVTDLFLVGGLLLFSRLLFVGRLLLIHWLMLATGLFLIHWLLVVTGLFLVRWLLFFRGLLFFHGLVVGLLLGLSLFCELLLGLLGLLIIHRLQVVSWLLRLRLSIRRSRILCRFILFCDVVYRRTDEKEAESRRILSHFNFRVTIDALIIHDHMEVA